MSDAKKYRPIFPLQEPIKDFLSIKGPQDKTRLIRFGLRTVFLVVTVFLANHYSDKYYSLNTAEKDVKSLLGHQKVKDESKEV